MQFFQKRLPRETSRHCCYMPHVISSHYKQPELWWLAWVWGYETGTAILPSNALRLWSKLRQCARKNLTSTAHERCRQNRSRFIFNYKPSQSAARHHLRYSSRRVKHSSSSHSFCLEQNTEHRRAKALYGTSFIRWMIYCSIKPKPRWINSVVFRRPASAALDA